jgi:mRNA interferase MazF
MGMVVARFDVFRVALDPTIGSEIQKTRPCVIISPDEMNLYLATAIVAPMTTKGKLYPSRVPVYFEGKDGLIVLDQIRTVDKTRLVKKLGTIDLNEQKVVLSILAEMFSED